MRGSYWIVLKRGVFVMAIGLLMGFGVEFIWLGRTGTVNVLACDIVFLATYLTLAWFTLFRREEFKKLELMWELENEAEEATANASFRRS